MHGKKTLRTEFGQLKSEKLVDLVKDAGVENPNLIQRSSKVK